MMHIEGLLRYCFYLSERFSLEPANSIELSRCYRAILSHTVKCEKRTRKRMDTQGHTLFSVNDYNTAPDAVKSNVLAALDKGVRVVVGTSGLTASDYAEIEQRARERKLGVMAAGNFSVTAALAKHFALIAAQHLPSWEIIDYASAAKIDAPSGTTRELAEELANVSQNQLEVALEDTHGAKEARGATIDGTQVHSIRLPGYVIAFETIFGLPDERLSIRHDAGSGAGPYVSGTLLATRKVMEVSGLIRGLDRLLFS